MMNRKLAIGILVASLILSITTSLTSQSFSAASIITTKPTASSGQALPTISSASTQKDRGQNGVTVQATWITEQYLRDKGREDEVEKYQLDKNLVFYIKMDTHSVDLTDFDVAKNVVLRPAGSREVSSNGWVSASDSSHHRSGYLSFSKPAVGDDSKYIELVVRDLAGVDERILRWDLR